VEAILDRSVGGHALVLDCLASAAAGRSAVSQALVRAKIDAAVARMFEPLLAHRQVRGPGEPMDDEVPGTAVHYVAFNGMYETAKLFCERGVALADTEPNTGATPMHTAVSRGHDRIADLLADYTGGAAAWDVLDTFGATPATRRATRDAPRRKASGPVRSGEKKTRPLGELPLTAPLSSSPFFAGLGLGERRVGRRAAGLGDERRRAVRHRRGDPRGA
jgi:hypothetical protein